MKTPYKQRIENAEQAINILANIDDRYYDTIRDAYLKATRVKSSRLALALKLEEVRDMASRLVFPLGNQTPRN
jgi:hypothetical protein